MVTRKTILKRLEHINLAGWSSFIKNVDKWIESNENELKSRKKGPRYASMKITRSLDLIVYHLWGVPSEKFPLEKAFEIALEAGQEYTATPGLAPGTNRPRDESWLSEMSTLMVIASLQKDDADLTQFSNWFTVDDHAFGDPYEISFQPILYHVANFFRDRKIRSFEKLNKFLATWRVKEPPLLMSALEGIQSRNLKKTYDDLIAASIDHAKRANVVLAKDQVNNFHNLVAMYPSLLWNVAELRGLEPPTMPPEIRPFMLTRQTLGLPPIQTAITSKASKPKVPKTAKAKTVKVPKSAKSAEKTAKAKNAKRNADEVT
jgi:hypothetical protein